MPPARRPDVRSTRCPAARHWSGIAVVWLLSCAPGEGERCICADDCRGGLVCAIEGRRVLERDECVMDDDLNRGVCIELDDAQGNAGLLDLPPPLPDDDTKRDFAPVQVAGDGSSGSGDTAETDGDTDTDSGDTDTDSGDTDTDSGDTDTDSGDTDTDSGDTDTDSGDTDTTSIG